MQFPNLSSPAFWVGVDGDCVRVVCHPLEQLARGSWHQVTGTGNWDMDGLRRDHLAGMFYSRSVAHNDPREALHPGACSVFLLQAPHGPPKGSPRNYEGSPRTY